MALHELSAGWSGVDTSADPEYFVIFLDTVNSLDSAKSYKHGIMRLMSLRRGHRVLDVGCGIGDDVRRMARIVGPTGQVVGLDTSQAMLAEAIKRSQDSLLPVEFQAGDALNLPFADSTFDSCRADRTLQHVADPVEAVMEMVRVTKSGGRIVVAEPDWSSLCVTPGEDKGCRIFQCWSSSIRNPSFGLRLTGLFRALDLANVQSFERTIALTEFQLADQLFNLQAAAKQAVSKGILEACEAEEWLTTLRTASERGALSATISGCSVVGTKLY